MPNDFVLHLILYAYYMIQTYVPVPTTVYYISIEDTHLKQVQSSILT